MAAKGATTFKTGGGILTSSNVLAAIPKPLKTERVRLKLPAIGQSATLEDRKDITELFQQVSRPKTKIRLDPVKALEPYNKKLTSVEAQRIIGILTDLHQKCNLIAIVPHIMRDIDAYSSLLNVEVVGALKEHKIQVENFRTDEQGYQQLASALNNATLSQISTRAKQSVVIGAPGQRDRHNSSRQAIKTDSVVSKTSSNTMRLDPISSNITSLAIAPDSAKDYAIAAINSDTSDLSAISALTKLQVTKYRMETSVRNLMRAFRDNEAVMINTLNQVGHQKGREMTTFGQCLRDLIDMIMDRLLITPIEQQEKLQFMAQVAAQGQHNQTVIEKLEQELSVAIEQRDAEVMQKNDIIKTLQHSLRNLESATEDDIRRAKTEAEKQIQTDNRTCDAKKVKLNSEIKHLNGILSSTTAEHREEELTLRKKKWKLESEIENWLQKYDEEMSEKQNEYEEIDAQYQEEKRQLLELERRFTTLETEYKAIMELKTAEKLQKEASARLLERRTQAASIIQSVWRTFMVRKALRTKLKKKKKGGRKKKK